MYLIKKLWHPEMFQGKYKNKNYFEGWYYKLIDSKQENVWAVIPGIAHGKSEDDHHAFVQVIEANSCNVHYFKYDISSFKFLENKFNVQIGNNLFTRDGIILDLKDQNISIQGQLSFQNIIPFPKGILRPGIMGPFSFVPFMECYHGVVNIHHEIEGSIAHNGTEISFNNGYGYIEKDWGKSFPESWIWIQSNHFPQGDVSLMFSIAKIPFLCSHFTGFLSFLRIGDRMFSFATYTGAKITKLQYMKDTILIDIADAKYTLHIKAFFSKGGVLKAPKNGLMNGEVTESITSTVMVSLYDHKSRANLFEGKGIHTGFEIGGNIEYFLQLGKS